MSSTIFHEMIDFGTGTGLTPWDVDNERWDGTRNGGTGHKRWDGVPQESWALREECNLFKEEAQR
jgi:hypothetical protein